MRNDNVSRKLRNFGIKISSLRKDFKDKYFNFKELETDFATFRNPFSTSAYDISEDLRNENYRLAV